MAGKFTNSLIVLVAALALVAGASAASPDVAAMNLQATDVPGARVVTQHAVKEQGYVAAHYRSFAFTSIGSARLISLESETALAASASTATSDVSAADKAFRSKAGRNAFIAAVAKAAKVKLKAVVLGQPRTVAGYDQGFEIATSIAIKGHRVYENLIIVRLDRVLVQLIESAGRPIGVGTTGKYMTAIAGHIGTELAPIAVTPPTVTGTAQQGQTLIATPGTWTAPDAKFGYQWQHCDAAGANCVDVAGATTATNRFGSAPATSALTTVVT